METTTIEDLFCAHCGYNLRALPTPRCPECGRLFDPATAALTRIPWAHRREIGRLRAFWRTVLLGTFRPARLAAELARPVSYPDAQAFRRVIIGVNLLPWLLLYGVGPMVRYARGELFAFNYLEGLFGDFNKMLHLGLIVPDPLAAATALLGVTLLLVAGTGLHTYFFHPRTLSLVQQNRAVALAYYAVAPLVWLPPILITTVLSVGLWVDQPIQSSPFANRALALLALAPGVAILGGLWYVPVSLLWRVPGISGLRVAGFAIFWPLSWILLPALCFGVPTAVVGFLYLCYATLR